MVLPASLTFKDHDKQVLTVFNPYSYELSYTILATKPEAFSVEPPKGVLPPSTSANVVISVKYKGAPPPLQLEERFQIGMVCYYCCLEILCSTCSPLVILVILKCVLF